MNRAEIDSLPEHARRWFGEHSPLSSRVAAFRSGHHEPQGSWSQMAEMGWLALTLPEGAGGSGATVEQAFDLIRSAGRDARPEPLGLHLMLAPYVARRLPNTAAALAQGSARLAMADVPQRDAAIEFTSTTLHGRFAVVEGAEHATHLLVPTGLGRGAPLMVIAMDAPGVRRTRARLVDGRTTAQLALDQVSARLLGDAGVAIDLAAAAFVADTCGVFEAAFAATRDDLRQASPSGRPRAEQPVVGDRMAEVFCDLQQQLALARRLAVEIDGAPEGPWPALPVAKSFIGRRVLPALGRLMDLAGSAATTEVHALSHLYRRAHVAAQLFGNAEAQLARIGVRTLLAAD